MALTPVPPKSLDKALAHVRAGGRLVIPTMTRCTVITKKTLESFERGGHWLLKEEGDSYRLRSGNSSVYLLPGQLAMEN